MLRGLTHVLAWSLATGAAVTLSSWGVHTVLDATAYDPPRALPVTAADPTVSEEEEPEDSPSARSSSAPPPAAPSQAAPPPTRQPSATTREPSPSTSATASSTTGRVRSYDTEGGRAVFDVGATSASLVSATPGTGWSMQVWKTERWIRVEFSSGADRVSVFCTWHDGPPRVNVGTY
ncbi:hypothetical protein [Streptomyces sp. NPDC088789]|uniref:hypothetical protein n=1 Tax=Streptomyces sp. NPDC088789 TaxID=3365899 RepID=UPI00381243BC